MALIEKDLEAIAVKHEAFGFGQVEPDGLTVHGFDPDGLRAFVAEVRKDDEALIRQMLAALENHDGNYKLSKSAGAAVDAAITAARSRLEKAP